MSTVDLVLTQDAFDGGMDRNSARHLIAPNKVYDIENGLLDDDGSVYRRGGTTQLVALFSNPTMWMHDSYYDCGRRTVYASTSEFQVVTGADTSATTIGGAGLAYPREAGQVASLLFIGSGFIYGGSQKAAAYNTGTVAVTKATYDAFGNCTNATAAKTVTGTGTTWNTLVDAGMLFQRGNERVYPIASVDSTTQVTLRDPYDGATGAGIAYNFRPLYTVTAADPYESSEFYFVSQKRLCWGTKDRFRFSEIEKPHSWTNVYGTANEHTIPEGVTITGGAAVGPNTLIFTTGGVWVLSGLAADIIDANGNPQHGLSPLSRERVLWGPAGIAYWNQLVVAPCEDGIYLLDGVSAPIELSRDLRPLYRSYVEKGYRPGGGAVYNSHYFLPILDGTGETQDTFVCRVDRASTDRRRRTSFPWSRLTDFGGKMSAYAVRSDDAGRQSRLLATMGPNTIGGGALLDCSGYFNPSASNKLDATPAGNNLGTFEDWVVTRDFQTGNGTINSVRKVRVKHELFDAASDNPVRYLDYSDGNLPPNQPKWGDPAGAWGTGFGPSGTAKWTLGLEADFLQLFGMNGADSAPESDGRDPFNFKVNKKLRYIRLRSRCGGPAAKSVLRSLEIFVRPSGALRR